MGIPYVQDSHSGRFYKHRRSSGIIKSLYRHIWDASQPRPFTRHARCSPRGWPAVTSIAPLLCNVGSGFESSSESLAGLIRRMQFGEHAHDATESSLRLVPSNTHHVPAINDIALSVGERCWVFSE
eukprot:4694492-Pleurochrysis_carterae.AAC.1